MILDNVPLAGYTTYGIGGTAKKFVSVSTEEELIDHLASHDLLGGFAVLGGGSNVLIADGEIDIPIVSTVGLKDIKIAREDESSVTLACGAGAQVARLVSLSRENAWSGLEDLAGIPGTIGGAVRGNAGTRRGSVGSAVQSLTILRPGGRKDKVSADRIDLGYRSCRLPFREDLIISEAELVLEKKDRDLVCQAIEEAKRTREGQPRGVRSAGCVFKNPKEAPAGKLLDDAGCKGLKVGGAVVSEHHANFIINSGGATSSDMMELIHLCAAKVAKDFGIALELEIKTIGMSAQIEKRFS